MESEQETSEAGVTPVKGPFTRLDHVGVAVADADAAIPYYRDVLGMELVADEITDEGTRLVYFQVGESCVQLLEPISPDNPVRQWLAEFGEGVHHICLAVDDLADAVRVSAEPSKVTIAAAGRNRNAVFLNGVHPPSVRIEVTETHPSR